MAGIFQLVTDHARLGPPQSAEALDALVALVAAAGEAGIDLVQVREPSLSDEALFRLVERLVARTPPNCRILVNERFDIALAAGASGVHLRASSLAASRVRRVLPPGFLIGRSVHTTTEIRAACRDAAVDYLLFGMVFPSASKASGHPAVGIAALGAAVRASNVPVLAIGGITVERIPQVAEVGAAGVAAIGWLTDAARRGTLPSELSAARQSFRTGATDLR
ncbi:MAG: thiamine phosphate synthase [Luteitalea sp.]|nr:thiamine phosphate synthase [Luteitalea sp.]